MMFTTPSIDCEQDRQSTTESTSHANTDDFPPPQLVQRKCIPLKLPWAARFLYQLLTDQENSHRSNRSQHCPQQHHQLRSPKRKCSRHHFRLANPSSAQLALLKSIYLLGYIFGPLVFRTLSEIYGRRTILLPTFFCFTAFTLGCARVPNWKALVVK